MSETDVRCGSPRELSTDPAGQMLVRGLDKQSHMTYITPQSTSNLQSEFLKEMF